ncbi:MAG: fibronectin type III domain-containing protein, partial [Spirochaetota bacterium]
MSVMQHYNIPCKNKLLIPPPYVSRGLRILSLLFIFISILSLLSCEDEVGKKAKKTAMIITSRETDAGVFEFRIDSLIKEDFVILERSKVPSKADIQEYWKNVNVRWGFRRRASGDSEPKIYWVQKNAGYRVSGDNNKYSVIAPEDTKHIFTPKDMPAVLFQEKESNLEIVATIIIDKFIKEATTDVPRNYRVDLMQATNISGKVFASMAGKMVPVSAASVFAVHKDSGKIFQTHSDMDGNYELSVRYYNEFLLSVVKDGMAVSGQNLVIRRDTKWAKKDVVLAEAKDDFAPNTLYNIPEGDAFTAKGMPAAGQTVSTEKAASVPGARLVFYNKTRKKAYVLFSDKAGKYSLNLPSDTASNDSPSDLVFSASAYGHVFEKGAFTLGEGSTIQSQLDVLTFTPRKRLSVPKIGAVTATTTSLTVNWTKVTNAGSYVLFYDVAEGITTASKTAKKVVANGVATSVKVDGLASGTKYFFRLFAAADAGGLYRDSELTAEQSQTLQKGTGSGPSNVVLSEIRSDSVKVSWTLPGDTSGVAAYELSWGPTALATAHTATANGARTPSYNITADLPADKALLYVKVRSKGDGRHEDSDWSATVNAKMPLEKPSNLASTAVAKSTVSLGWTAVADALSYTVYYSKTGNFTIDSLTLRLNTATNSAKVIGLAPATPYYFKVVAHGTGYPSSSPSNQFAKTTTSKVEAPSNVLIGAVTASSA